MAFDLSSIPAGAVAAQVEQKAVECREAATCLAAAAYHLQEYARLGPVAGAVRDGAVLARAVLASKDLKAGRPVTIDHELINFLGLGPEAFAGGGADAADSMSSVVLDRAAGAAREARERHQDVLVRLLRLAHLYRWLAEPAGKEPPPAADDLEEVLKLWPSTSAGAAAPGSPTA